MKARPLTRGETEMASLIFGDAIDYPRVKVHSGCYLPFGLQPGNVAMAPNGEMYFPGACFKEDFSQEITTDKHWFMHEMVHVWQHQLRYPVRLRGAVRIGLRYDYLLTPQKRLCDYNMEAQGDLLADYFVLKCLSAPEAMRQSKYAQDMALYEAVLGDFFADRKSVSNLPRSRMRRNAAAGGGH